jgi:hypothetical protein
MLAVLDPERREVEQLVTFAAIAEIFGACTIVIGAVFALVQLGEFKKQQRYHAAAELCREFTEPKLARSVTLLKNLPDGLSLQGFRELDLEYEEAAQMVGMTFETMGLMVYRDMASFTIVQELTGGLLLMMWRKIGIWIRETREEQGNPRFGEWIQWLAERIAECEPDMRPAHEQHAGWNKHRSK